MKTIICSLDKHAKLKICINNNFFSSSSLSILLLLLMFFGTIVQSASATDPFCADNSTNTIITTSITCSNITMTKHGSVTINSPGTLTLDNSTLIMYADLNDNNAASASYNMNNGSYLKMGTNLTGVKATALIKGTNNRIVNSTITTINESDGTDECDKSGQNGKGYVQFFNTVGLYISNSTFTCQGNAGLNVQDNVDTDSSMTIIDSTIYWNYRGLYAQGANNVTFLRNNITRSEVDGVFLDGKLANNFNWNISDNIISQVDRGILLYNSVHDIRTKNNTITSTNWSDGEMTGIQLWKSNYNVTLDSDNITFGSVGISVFNNNSNVTIKNSILFPIDQTTLFNLYGAGNSQGQTWNGPVMGIAIPEQIGAYVLDSTEEFLINRTHLSKYNSTNITISNITFSNNIPIILRTQGTTNLTFDSSKYNYWTFDMLYPRMFDRDTLYVNKNSTFPDVAVQWFFNRTNSFATRKTITSQHQIYSAFSANASRTTFSSAGQEVNWNYIINGQNNITILPQGFVWNSTTGAITNVSDYAGSQYPFDFYLFMNGTPLFGSSKNVTIFSNGTTYTQLLNDTLEPNGYYTINASIIPVSDSINLSISLWNSSHIEWNESSPNTSNIVRYTIRDRQPNTNYTVRIYWNNGTKFQDFYIKSNNTGYIDYNTTGYEFDRYTIITQENPTTPYVVIVIAVTVIIGGVAYIVRKIVKV